jgi:hypothetical protein
MSKVSESRPSIKPRTEAEIRTLDGVTQINTGLGWINYPASASKLIQMAYDHGWGVDDGLPPRFLHDGTAYIRVVLGRDPGPNAGDAAGYRSEGYQFRAVWYLHDMTRRWAAGGIQYRSTAFEGWKTCDYIAHVRRFIAQNPIKVPTEYAEANN